MRIFTWGAVALLAALVAAPLAAKEPSVSDKPAKPAAAAEPSPEAAIRATADAFLAAFAKGDAKAVAALWTEEGTLADERGQIFKGRAAIEAEYAALFKARPGAKLEIAITQVHVAGPGIAIEDGTARLVTAGGPPSASRYSAVHVKEKEGWKMLSVRESALEAASGHDRIAELDWLIGTWRHHRDDLAIEARFRYVAGKSFLQRDTTARRGGVEVASGTQIIGFDPQTGRVRVWAFDSSGGRSEGVATKTAAGYLIESRGVLADGTPTAASEQYLRIAGENDVFGWRSYNRTAGGTALADLPEIVFERVKETK